MSKYNKITKLLFTALTATLLTACGGGTSTSYTNTATGEEITLGIDNPTCQEGFATQEGKIIDSKTNKGISNVSVEIAGCTITTDENGFYKFSNIPSIARTSVNFTKDGYLNNSKIIQIKNQTTNYLETSLSTSKWDWTYNSKNGTSGGSVVISPNTVYADNDENNYTGEINAYYTLKNTSTTEGRDMFPGSYQGIDSNGIVVSFVSYSFLVLDLKDNKMNTLHTSGTITIEVDNIKGIKDQEIPLWYYNNDKGIWIEKGSAQKDGNGNYICAISHPGTWSLSKPIETEMGLYRGKIVDSDENPITNVRMQAIGKNWITEDLTTDENGVFEIYVVPNQAFTLSAYDYKEKFGAYFGDTIPAIASGDVAGE